MDEEDVTAMFEVEAHEQHVDAMEDDSDLEAEEMGNYLRSDCEGGMRTTKKNLTRSKKISQT